MTKATQDALRRAQGAYRAYMGNLDNPKATTRAINRSQETFHAATEVLFHHISMDERTPPADYDTGE